MRRQGEEEEGRSVQDFKLEVLVANNALTIEKHINEIQYNSDRCLQNITIQILKGKLAYSFYILWTQRHESAASKLTNFHVFYYSSPIERDIIFKEPLSFCTS